MQCVRLDKGPTCCVKASGAWNLDTTQRRIKVHTVAHHCYNCYDFKLVLRTDWLLQQPMLLHLALSGPKKSYSKASLTHMHVYTSPKQLQADSTLVW
jgi:hypothetical protein